MRYDATGYVENKMISLLPEGWLGFKIVDVEERTSTKGYYQVVAKCRCIDSQIELSVQEETEVWHFVTFIPVENQNGKPNKGVGIALHWLDVLGEPCNGEFDIEPVNWIGKTFMGKVVINEYVSATGEPRKNNKLVEIAPVKKSENPKEDEGDVEF